LPRKLEPLIVQTRCPVAFTVAFTSMVIVAEGSFAGIGKDGIVTERSSFAHGLVVSAWAVEFFIFGEAVLFACS